MISEKLACILPSVTLEITASAKKMAKEGKRIVSFAAGEPDFPTPEHVKEAAIKAIHNNFTRYTPASGMPELKEAVCRKLKSENGLSYAPSQILISCGAKHSLFNAIMTVIDKDDEVLIPSPYWVSYPEMVKIAGGKIKFMETTKENNFKITKDDLKKAIGKKTKLLILNSPSNPTGSLYSKEELAGLAEVIVDKNILVISDDIYEKIIYDDAEFHSIASFGDKIKDLTILVNGVSKTYSMTGWRIGYLAAALPIVKAASNLQSHSTSNPCSISQKAAQAAIDSDQSFIEGIVKEFKRRRDYLVENLNGDMIKVEKPRGTFYAFCDISATGMDSVTFCKKLLDEAGVAVIPGGAFGCDDFIRISFACSLDDIKEGVEKIKNWLKRENKN
ncbi:MAG: pyridoxal phosphate-dependent aminotransferase [Candidatus Omnitrophota bacterium]